jgi:TolA-binding protein
MDIERTMQFILEHQAKAEVEMAAMRERHAEWLAEFEEKSAESKAKADHDFAAMREILDDTMRVQREQTRLQIKTETQLSQLADRVDQLAASQIITEVKLQGLIDALQRGANGRE